MSDAARTFTSHETSGRPSVSSGPLRDWLAAMRATAPETRQEAPRAAEPAAPAAVPVEERAQGWSPRVISPAPKADAQEDEVAEIVAENLMLKAKLRLEAERRDELQILLAQEIREMREHIRTEVENLEDLRADRDLWKARCEALMQPLFSRG